MALLILANSQVPQPILPPVTFNATQQRDIACVAVVALVANEQERGAPSNATLIDVRANGKRWAAVVGNRIVAETGAPPELVGVAMTEAAKAEQSAAMASPDPKQQRAERIKMCVPLMQADLLANAPLPTPVKAQKAKKP